MTTNLNTIHMKRLFLFAIGMMISIIVVAQSRTNPDVAEYYIKGNLSINQGPNGKPVYKLSNILTRGISFDNSDNSNAIWIGEDTKFEDVLFQFEHYFTNYPGGIGAELDFWRFDESIMEWQPDGETRQGNAKVPDNKTMVLMLVLDCSSSLKSDFRKVQGAAKDFIKDMLNASNGNGQVKIGIVAFSKIGETEFFPITSLNSYSSNDMCEFIDRQHIANGTALYYAMDKAIDSMEYFCAHSIPKDEPLSSAIMVTFTDGLDQTSRSESKGIKTAEEYYAVVQSKMKDKKIDNIPLQSKIRGVRGDDIVTEAQLGKFNQIGNSLGEFKLLNDVSELGQEFKDIAKGLIGNFVVMECYVPNSFEGRVAWTYQSKKPRNKWFVGLNVGAGEFCKSDGDFAITGGFDMAFPLGKYVNFGIYFSVGYSPEAPSDAFLEAGPLFLINFDNGGSLYFGGGWADTFNEPGFNGRMGYKFKNGLYLFGDYMDCRWAGYAATLNIGYSF